MRQGRGRFLICGMDAGRGRALQEPGREREQSVTSWGPPSSGSLPRRRSRCRMRRSRRGRCRPRSPRRWSRPRRPRRPCRRCAPVVWSTGSADRAPQSDAPERDDARGAGARDVEETREEEAAVGFAVVRRARLSAKGWRGRGGAPVAVVHGGSMSRKTSTRGAAERASNNGRPAGRNPGRRA